MVVKNAELVGVLNGIEIYHIIDCDLLPYRPFSSHLSERQVLHYPTLLLAYNCTGHINRRGLIGTSSK